MKKKSSKKLSLKDKITYRIYQGANLVNSLYDEVPFLGAGFKKGGIVKARRGSGKNLIGSKLVSKFYD